MRLSVHPRAGRRRSSTFAGLRVFCILCLLSGAATAAPVGTISEREAIEAALSRDDYRALETSRREVAEAELEAAGLLPNPSAALNREGFTTAGDRTIETSYELSQQVDLAGRRRLARDAAARRLAATDFDTLDARRTTIAEVRLAFGEVLYRSRVVDVLDAGLAQLAGAHAAMERQAAAGEASGFDQRRVAREIQRARAELATAGAELARGRAVLASRIGADAGIELKPTGTPLPPPPPPLSELRERLPERHDFAALLARADAADRELQSATRAWIPELTVGIGNRVIETAGNVNDRVMLSLSMPLPVFNRGQAAARRAAALREGLRAEHALRRSRLDGELEGLWQQASQLHAAASEFRREALTVSRELMQIARTAYTAGEGSVLDLIDAWRTELDAELTSLDLDYRARLARIELDRIAGVTAHD